MCEQSARAFFRHRSPLRSAAFIAQSPLFRAAGGARLQDVQVPPPGLFADFAMLEEVPQRMSIAAVSLFYCKVQTVISTYIFVSCLLRF